MRKFSLYLIFSLLILMLPFAFILLLEYVKPFSEIRKEYVGLINGYLASLVVLTGVLITIKQSKKQEKENFRLEKMPYIEIEFINEIPSYRDGGSIIFGDSTDSTENKKGYLKIVNNGFGPALDFSIINISFNFEDLSMSILNDKILKPACSMNILVMGYFNLPSIKDKPQDDFHKIKNLQQPLYFDVTYKDFLGNEYIDEFMLNFAVSGLYFENKGEKLELNVHPLKKKNSKVNIKV